MKIQYLTFVDIETIGKNVNADPATDSTIEVAAARVDLTTRKIVDKFDTLIRPWGPDSVQVPTGGRPRTEWDLGAFHKAQGTFHGVDFSQGLMLSTALSTLAERFLTPGATVAGQNVGFDLRYLRRDFAELNLSWPALDYHVIDLCPSAMFLYMAGKVESLSLRSLVKWAYADPNRKQSHRAMDDVLDEIRVFWAMFDYYTEGKRPEQFAFPFQGWEGKQP